MAFASRVPKFLPGGDGGPRGVSPAELVLRKRTEAFSAAAGFSEQTTLLVQLFSGIWLPSSERAFHSSLNRWIAMLEHDANLRSRFQTTWQSMVASLDCVGLFAEAGLPAQQALLSETTRRIFRRFLPMAREETDTGRLFASIFSSPRAVQRFLDLDATVFARLAGILWDRQGLDAFPQVRKCLHQALRLLAARVMGRGTSAAVRPRSATQQVEESPFYRLVFATERFLEPTDSEPACSRMDRWLETIYACRGELALVRLHMEDSGVSTAMVFDLSSMDAALDRMELLAATLVDSPERSPAAVRRLLDTLVRAVLEDTRVSSLIRQNLNLLARKMVERTGHGGEHYIAHDRREYWRMWLAALGGGVLTVFTAALKLHIVGTKWPPFLEGILVGTDYAISFLLLQIFGLALATKQPSMTGATLADIIRRNRGVARRDKIADFGASISRTQLAAALGNVLAVTTGAVVFDQVWRAVFHSPYLPVDQAQQVYGSLNPLRSGTIIDAALTGVVLWLAALIGGWCENFAVYNRIPAAIAQHPLGRKIGAPRMQSLANWFDNNIGAWSTSISLGYLLGFTPEIAHFFGLPLDVRHVTLNTGMFAFAAARFGFLALGQLWLYAAIAGIATMFVLNLGVSFAVASFVALRAYDVERPERLSILRDVLKQIVQSPLRFLYPVEAPPPPVHQPAELAGQAETAKVEEPGETTPTVSNP
jgi:site-specific recombinase